MKNFITGLLIILIGSIISSFIPEDNGTGIYILGFIVGLIVGIIEKDISSNGKN